MSPSWSEKYSEPGRASDDATSKWPWARSLAMATQGQTLQVGRILFGSVQDRCHALDIRPGTVLTCTGRDADGVDLQLPGGVRRRLPRHYAWFVSVEFI